jgi:PPM family protein phosphatase
MQWVCDWGLVCDKGVRRPENQDASLFWTRNHKLRLPADEDRLTINGGSLTLSAQSSRKNNDPVRSEPDLVGIIADGMGGGPAGARASQIIVDMAYEAAKKKFPCHPEVWLQQLIDSTDMSIFQEASSKGLTGMGSTCTSVMIADGRVHLCHVGDSRCYRLGHGESNIKQWSRDQNMAAKMVEEGSLAPEDAASHPGSHILIQAVGLGKSPEPQIEQADLSAEGEIFLVCSDGLIRVLEEREIVLSVIPYADVESHSGEEAVGGAGDKRPMQLAAEQLLALANRRESPDNVSILILNIKPLS